MRSTERRSRSTWSCSGRRGAGKGTQAERFARARGLPKISTGDILREAVQAETELGRVAKATMEAGNLLGDDVMIGIVRQRLDAATRAADSCSTGFRARWCRRRRSTR